MDHRAEEEEEIEGVEIFWLQVSLLHHRVREVCSDGISAVFCVYSMCVDFESDRQMSILKNATHRRLIPCALLVKTEIILLSPSSASSIPILNLKPQVLLGISMWTIFT